MFYAIYTELCEKHDEKPYSLPLKLGAKSNSMVAQWKAGSTPRPELLQKIADYFGVSTAYLLGYEQKKEPTPNWDELKPEDIKGLLERMSRDQLLDVIATATNIAMRKGDEQK